MTAEAFVARWLELNGPARDAFLQANIDALNDDVVQLMKARATEHRLINGREALALAQSILTAANLTSQPLHLGWALMALGNVYVSLGQYEVAIAAYDEAQAVCARAGRPVEAARSQIGKVLSLCHLSRYDEALKTAKR